MKRVIVTGATGTIGTALIKELMGHNIEVLVLCREGSPRNANIPLSDLVNLKFASLDDFATLDNDTGKTYDVFFHLAWDGTTGQARNDIPRQSRNIQYSLDAVKLAKTFGCETFVGAGSQAEYGRVEGVLKTQTPTYPENGYGMAKLASGLMTRELARQLGMRHIWIRVVSVYGPNDGVQTLVMSLISKLAKGESPKMTKGEQMWDYLYSGDAAKAFYLLGEKGKDRKTYILGNGKARPLKEYAEIIRKTVNPAMSVDYGAIPYAERQVMHLCADISDLKQDIGWMPQTSFEQGIAATFEDYLKQQTNA